MAEVVCSSLHWLLRSTDIAIARMQAVVALLVVVTLGECSPDQSLVTHERSRCDVPQGLLELIIGSLLLYVDLHND
jgi:hypothetical protein